MSIGNYTNPPSVTNHRQGQAVVLSPLTLAPSQIDKYSGIYRAVTSPQSLCRTWLKMFYLEMRLSFGQSGRGEREHMRCQWSIRADLGRVTKCQSQSPSQIIRSENSNQEFWHRTNPSLFIHPKLLLTPDWPEDWCQINRVLSPCQLIQIRQDNGLLLGVLFTQYGEDFIH